MKYKLKRNFENFDVVDGPFAGKKFRRGKVYRKEDIPENEIKKFEPLGESSARLIKKMGEKSKPVKPAEDAGDGGKAAGKAKPKK